VVRNYVASNGSVSAVARDNLAGIVSGQAIVLAYGDVSRIVGIVTLGLTPLCLLLSAHKAKPGVAVEA
jgi:hypothetical protein